MLELGTESGPFALSKCLKAAGHTDNREPDSKDQSFPLYWRSACHSAEQNVPTWQLKLGSRDQSAGTGVSEINEHITTKADDAEDRHQKLHVHLFNTKGFKNTSDGVFFVPELLLQPEHLING